MKTRLLPFWLFRSGTSRGPYILRTDISTVLSLRTNNNNNNEQGELNKEEVDVVLDLVGSGNQLEGVGGGTSVTNKACVVENHPDSEYACKYWFLQCGVEDRVVHMNHGDCGNMIAAVGAFALESGLIKSPLKSPKTTIQVHSNSTGNIFEIDVPTPGGHSIKYDGDLVIAGVQGSGSPFSVHSLKPAGATTGKLWPSLNPKTTLERTNVQVTCIDVTRSLVIVDFDDVKDCMTSLLGDAKPSLDQNLVLMEKLERIRIEAGAKMGLGDVSKKVAPKLCVVGKPTNEKAAIAVRYFVAPFQNDSHPTIAMTAGQALAVACLYKGTTANDHLSNGGLIDSESGKERIVTLQHPKGLVSISVDIEHGILDQNGTNIRRTGYTRTIKPIARGEKIYYCNSDDDVHV